MANRQVSKYRMRLPLRFLAPKANVVSLTRNEINPRHSHQSTRSSVISAKINVTLHIHSVHSKHVPFSSIVYIHGEFKVSRFVRVDLMVKLYNWNARKLHPLYNNNDTAKEMGETKSNLRFFRITVYSQSNICTALGLIQINIECKCLFANRIARNCAYRHERMEHIHRKRKK